MTDSRSWAEPRRVFCSVLVSRRIKPITAFQSFSNFVRSRLELHQTFFFRKVAALLVIPSLHPWQQLEEKPAGRQSHFVGPAQPRKRRDRSPWPLRLARGGHTKKPFSAIGADCRPGPRRVRLPSSSLSFPLRPQSRFSHPFPGLV